MKITLSFFVVLSLLCGEIHAQEYRYTRYDVNDGLAGSTVYCMLQDQHGFMWFGTETGVSRFDGARFKNFGTTDGLPDNEILEMFQDSKGRIWMAPFRKSVCYYYKGRIYNNENDSLLSKIKVKSHLLSFTEDENGNILMFETGQLHLVSGNEVMRFDSIDGNSMAPFLAISKNRKGGFLVFANSRLYVLRNKKFDLVSTKNLVSANHIYVSLNEYFLSYRVDSNSRVVTNFETGAKMKIPFLKTQLKNELIGDSFLVSNNLTGSTFYPLKAGHSLKEFMDGKAVTKSFIDNEGNYWFATRSEGVYRFSIKNIAFNELKNYRGRKLAAYTVKIASPGKWIIGADMFNVFEIKHDSSGSLQKILIWDEFHSETPARVTALEVFNESTSLLGSDMILECIPSDRNSIDITTSVKSIQKKTDSEFLVATRSSVIMVRLPELRIIDTLWNERATTAFQRNDTTYVGTLEGLYVVAKGRAKVFAGENLRLLRNRINAITSSADGLLWIATNGAGMLAYRNGRIERRINISNGLSSDNCRCIYMNGQDLWIGTDKGLNRVMFNQDTFKIIKFKVGDGLSSNVINSVGVDGNTVVVATPEGINYFYVHKVAVESHCGLVLDNILVSDQHINPSARSFSLKPRDNNIRFEYAGISFRFGGEISYEYRLLGLDTTWKSTTENFLSYPTLPSGNYQLQLQAVNKFGIKSDVLSIPFTVEKLLMEKIWFRLILSFALVFMIMAYVVWLTRKVKKRELEKSEVSRRISELEQLALKSQMNPHFIFNCLNSIQQFVLDKDVAGSNRFITGFSRLIRQTLDISARKEISLTEEIRYLSTYLELEKTRFENKFSFEIRTGDEIDPEQFYLPPMMLQPFVENSIRHGIRYRPDNLGKILISFDMMEEDLVCLVQDNGIGRAAALRHKSSNPIEYQSKGMSLIASRVEFLNRHSSRPITIQIEDLEDSNSISQGTRVVMKFPLEKRT